MKIRIPLSRPDIGELERRRVAAVLASDVLSRGPVLARLEQQMARAVDRRHAVGVSSGTAALHLSLLALEIGPGDEVITTPFSVPASVNPILAVGAQVVFADIDPQRLALDPDAAAKAITPRTRAILAVHPFGLPADIDALSKLAQAHGLHLIEDACEALGTRLDSGPAGRFGTISAFGFYPNKPLTMGEGGMAVTDDADLAQRIARLANHGRAMDGRWLDQDLVGFNYRLSELHAALGLAQLERREELLEARRQRAQRYLDRLAGSPWVLPNIPPHCQAVGWFAFVVRFPSHLGRPQRDHLVREAAEHGIQLGRYFAPLHRQPALLERMGQSPGGYPVTDAVADRCLALPLYSTLSPDDQDTVCRFLLDALD